MPNTEKAVIKGVARCVKQIDLILATDISKMDAFYIDTARELLMKIIASNGYDISLKTHRVTKIKRK